MMFTAVLLTLLAKSHGQSYETIQCPTNEVYQSCSETEFECFQTLQEQPETCGPPKCVCPASLQFRRNAAGSCIPQRNCYSLPSSAPSCERKICDRYKGCVLLEGPCTTQPCYPTPTCNYTCRANNCQQSERCILRKNPYCTEEPCELYPRCVPISERSVTSTSITRTTVGPSTSCSTNEVFQNCSEPEFECFQTMTEQTVICGPPKCVCPASLQFRRAANGSCIRQPDCYSLPRNAPSCERKICDIYQGCLLLEGPCTSPPCYPTPTCKYTCRANNCHQNERCLLRKNSLCVREPCDLYPRCVPLNNVSQRNTAAK